MTRIAKHSANTPVQVPADSYICMCGLSKNKPYCDGAHRATAGEEEGKTYSYESGSRQEVEVSVK